MVQVSYAVVQSEGLKSVVPDVARLRMEVFREFPYLYDGTIEYENKYLEPFASSKNSMLVVAQIGTHIVGCITGIPFIEASAECRAPFAKAGIPIDSIFYLGEIVLEKEYRGNGIGARMFETFIKFVKEQKKYSQIAICEVARHADHSQQDHFNLDTFWSKRQFVKQPQLITHFNWREVGRETEEAHPMVYWLKKV